MTVAIYHPSHIKRGRATKAEVEQRREALLAIIDAGRPMTVRQVFYQATVHGLVEKAESGYAKVQTDLTVMRRAGDLPYDWLADNTRWQRKPNTFDSVKDALQATARFYRKALWKDIDAYVEIWLEKDALSGVIYPVTEMYDVPLMVARGYASLSFLYSAAEYINDLTVPAYIYHLGDFDLSGINAGEKIEETLREMALDAEIYFERIAVTPWFSHPAPDRKRPKENHSWCVWRHSTLRSAPLIPYASRNYAHLATLPRIKTIRTSQLFFASKLPATAGCPSSTPATLPPEKDQS